MTVKIIVAKSLELDFKTTVLVVEGRRAVNRVTVLPGKNVTAVDLRPWEVKTVGFTPLNGGSYRVDTRVGEIPIDLPAAPVDRFQFHLRDMFETFDNHPAVLARGAPDQKLSNRDADELALDYSPGTLTVVYDAASKNWGI